MFDKVNEGGVREGEFGKFKNPTELLRAYRCLESEFTKKCQQLKRIKKIGANVADAYGAGDEKDTAENGAAVAREVTQSDAMIANNAVNAGNGEANGFDGDKAETAKRAEISVEKDQNYRGDGAVGNNGDDAFAENAVESVTAVAKDGVNVGDGANADNGENDMTYTQSDNRKNGEDTSAKSDDLVTTGATLSENRGSAPTRIEEGNVGFDKAKNNAFDAREISNGTALNALTADGDAAEHSETLSVGLKNNALDARGISGIDGMRKEEGDVLPSVSFDDAVVAYVSANDVIRKKIIGNYLASVKRREVVPMLLGGGISAPVPLRKIQTLDDAAEETVKLFMKK